jgi:hypothetical protein
LPTSKRGSWRWVRCWTRCRPTPTHFRTLSLDGIVCTDDFARNRLLPAVRSNTSLRQLHARYTFNEFLQEAVALVAARKEAEPRGMIAHARQLLPAAQAVARAVFWRSPRLRARPRAAHHLPAVQLALRGGAAGIRTAALALRLDALTLSSYCGLSPASAPALARLLAGGALRTLALVNSLQQLLDTPAVATLGAALHTNTTLTELTLRGCGLQHDPVATCALLAARTWGTPAWRRSASAASAWASASAKTT